MRDTLANRKMSPRLYMAIKDPGVAAIEDAARRCASRGHRRANLMAGRMRWPVHYLAQIDEMILDGTPDAEIVAFGETMAHVARARVYVGRSAPQESVGEALAHKHREEGESNAAASRLLDGMTESELLAARHEAIEHRCAIDRLIRVLDREIARKRADVPPPGGA